jgi:hypothetical protein
VLPEGELGEGLQGFAKSSENLVLFLDCLFGAPVTPGNLADGKLGHLRREPEGFPDVRVQPLLQADVGELSFRKGNRRNRVAGCIVPLHRGEQHPPFVGRRKQPQLRHRLHTPSRLALTRHKEYLCGVKVYRDMRRADASPDEKEGGSSAHDPESVFG